MSTCTDPGQDMWPKHVAVVYKEHVCSYVSTDLQEVTSTKSVMPKDAMCREFYVLCCALYVLGCAFYVL